jgi:penicillin V acylase-like amidase (Ntn superfamily)
MMRMTDVRERMFLGVLALALLLISCGGQGATPVLAPAGTYLTASSDTCTSFCLENDGYAVFGTNYDHWFPDGLLFVNKRDVSKTARDPSITGKYARWTTQYGSVTFNLVGYQYAWAGMNEAGLMISTMALDETQNPAPDTRPPITSPIWLQYQLDNCATVAEVLASDTVVRIADTVDHYLVCDRTRSCATIEFLGGEMVAHSGEALPVAALANSVYEESVRAWQKGALSNDSLRRFGAAADRVQGFDPQGARSAVDYAFDTLEQVGDPWWTQWSIVFDAENMRVYFRTRTNRQIRHIDFDTLDFACGTPVKMLDLHENLSGDVSNDLVAYSHEMSFDHMANFVEKWGLDISVQWIETSLRRMERFPCVEGGAHIQPVQESARAAPAPTPHEAAASDDRNAVVPLLALAPVALIAVYVAYRWRRSHSA